MTMKKKDIPQSFINRKNHMAVIHLEDIFGKQSAPTEQVVQKRPLQR